MFYAFAQPLMDLAVNRCPRGASSRDGTQARHLVPILFWTDATQVEAVIRQIVTADLHHGHSSASRCFCCDMTPIVRGPTDAHAAQL